ncbi:MAG: FAD-binding oxidoreductase [Chloroflexota bacterium]
MSETSPTAGAIAEIRSIVGQVHVLTAPVETACYASGQADAVVLPAGAPEAAAVLAVANRLHLPVLSRGGGTGLPSDPPLAGGIIMSTARLNRILEVDTANLTATVEPGAVLADLQASVERLGLFYPPDPASLAVATMGGTIATNASGPRGLKYGATKDFVLGLEMALADGTLLHTGARTMKSASGYDLTHLFVGSRGTLGLVTRVTARLLPLPEARCLLVASFANAVGAARAALAVVGARLQPSALELLDGTVLSALDTFRSSPLPAVAGAVLVCEVDGSRSAVDHQSAAIAALLASNGAAVVTKLDDPADGEALWTARRGAYPALARGHGDPTFAKAIVPRDRLPSLIETATAATRHHGLSAAILAHAGGGIVHPVIFADPDQIERRAACLAEIARAAAALGGRLVDGPGGTDGVAMAMMADLRAAFDPHGILNPGQTPFALGRAARGPASGASDDG